MDVVHPRCAGIDCSKKEAKVCVRIQGQARTPTSSTVTTWGATTSQILPTGTRSADRHDLQSWLSAILTCTPFPEEPANPMGPSFGANLKPHMA